MSQRPPVDRERISSFLDRLGKLFNKPGQIYLVGGTTMVYEGFRPQTLDIDLAYQVDDQDHAEFVRAVQTLKNELGINVEEASPQDFIPLPEGHEGRTKFVGRFGQLDVFHFDPYSVALSKIERGQDADFADVIALLRAGWIEFDLLRTYFESILPQFREHSLKANPEEFQRKFSYLQDLWHAV